MRHVCPILRDTTLVVCRPCASSQTRRVRWSRYQALVVTPQRSDDKGMVITREIETIRSRVGYPSGVLAGSTFAKVWGGIQVVLEYAVLHR